MQKIFRSFLFPVLCACLLQACYTSERVVYFQNKSTSVAGSDIIRFEAKLQPGDLLSVQISSISKEASSFFNVQVDQRTGNMVQQGFLVDDGGSIELPLVGKVMVSGLSVRQAKDTLRHKLERFLVDPAVNIQFLNYRVTVLGDVGRPGVYTASSDKITIPELFGMAGDLQLTARRDNVLIVREKDGKREFGTVDITTRTMFESPYYYLQTGDIIYVEPGKAKIASTSNFNRYFPIVLSSVSIFINILFRFI
jgi:polysaccharide biosynthesis/export protein